MPEHIVALVTLITGFVVTVMTTRALLVQVLVDPITV